MRKEFRVSGARGRRRRGKRPSVAERQMQLLGARPVVAPSDEVRARWGLAPLPTCDDAYERMIERTERRDG